MTQATLRYIVTKLTNVPHRRWCTCRSTASFKNGSQAKARRPVIYLPPSFARHFWTTAFKSPNFEFDEVCLLNIITIDRAEQAHGQKSLLQSKCRYVTKKVTAHPPIPPLLIQNIIRMQRQSTRHQHLKMQKVPICTPSMRLSATSTQLKASGIESVCRNIKNKMTQPNRCKAYQSISLRANGHATNVNVGKHHSCKRIKNQKYRREREREIKMYRKAGMANDWTVVNGPAKTNGWMNSNCNKCFWDDTRELLTI